MNRYAGNDRIDDPTLGRFISADPTIQAPFMSQSLNRYSYVLNNPLSMIDPSGFSWLSSAFRSIGNFISKYWRAIAAVVVAVFAPYLLGMYMGITGIAASVITGMLAGGIATGTWQGAVLGGVAGALFYAAGTLAGHLSRTVEGASHWGDGTVGHAFIHAVAGCASAAIGGGSCGRGALSASFADYAGAKVPSGGQEFVKAVEHGAVGGVSSTLSGGSFGDGFVQGVAGQEFNREAHAFFVKVAVARILQVGYSTADGFTEDFDIGKSFSIDLSDGEATVTQGGQSWTMSVGGLKSAGGLWRLFPDKLISMRLGLDATTDGSLEVRGSITYSPGKWLGVSVGDNYTVAVMPFVMTSSGLLGEAARAETAHHDYLHSL